MNTKKLYFWSITVALAGFLFGFDTIVISGAEQSIQAIWKTGGFFHSFFIMSMALWGTVIGAIFGGIPTDKLGRKKTLFLIGLLYFISALGSGIATDPYTFSFFRFLGGLGVGASTVAAPIYIAEIAPAKQRGRLVAMYQFNIVFGILIAFLSNMLINKYIEVNAWRWMLGIEALPALIYCIMILFVPNSPRWLYLFKKNKDEAEKVLQLINPNVDTEKQFSEMEDAEKVSSNSSEPLFKKKYAKLIGLAFFIAFFNQVSGINAFLYYANRIFESAGLSENASFLSGIGVGVINLIFTLIGVALIDKMGRKKLMYIGSFGYIVSLSLVSMAFAQNWQGIMVPVFLFIFIAAHAIGQGAVIWVFISEIFPNSIRGKGQSLGTSTHWVFAALITLFMSPALESFSNPWPVFVFFAIMMVIQLLWVHKYMPETKGVSLEELSKKLISNESQNNNQNNETMKPP